MTLPAMWEKLSDRGVWKNAPTYHGSRCRHNALRGDVRLESVYLAVLRVSEVVDL